MCNGHEPVRDDGARPGVQDVEVGVLFSVILSPTLASPIPVCDTESLACVAVW